MRPVAVFRFSPTEGPAYFAQWLEAHGIAVELVAIDGAAKVPSDPRVFAGIGMMGGPMSANDDLPWIEPMCALLRNALDARVPIVGHCLGGQLLARAMGAAVTRSPVPELGWGEVDVEGDAGAAWFGGRERFTTFQWHYETFALPAGAKRVLANAVVPNQAFVVDDMHLGLQSHVEMTETLVKSWLAAGAHELPETSSATMQCAADMRHDLPARIAALHEVADAVYTRWARALRVQDSRR